MATQLFIHIGMPKTGTSLIQAVLASMRDPLAEQGLVARNQSVLVREGGLEVRFSGLGTQFT